jgi:hypothetical protein
MRPLPIIAAVLTLVAPAAAQLYPPLTEAQIEEVRTALASMKRDERGPYLQIRWFCADGTVHPPQGTPCRELGGGVQHAELNDRARHLGDLLFHVGTLLTPLGFDALFDAERDHYRLKELILHQYLFEIDDGWVLRRARYYRGARQIEDEEAKGGAFLEWLLAQPAWTASHFLLAARATAVIPHGSLGGEQATHRIRNLATELAALNERYQALRVKIHSFPSRDDLDSVTAAVGRVEPGTPVADKLSELRDELHRQYEGRAAIEQLQRYERRLGPPLADELAGLRERLSVGAREEALTRIADLLPRLRATIATSADGRRNLVLMDLSLALQEQAFVLAQAPEGPRSRAERLRDLTRYVAVAHGAGFLSAREREALDGGVARLETGDTLTALGYRDALSYLARSLDWATATARSSFGPVLGRYVHVEPAANGFLDALVRGSAVLPLSTRLDALAVEADRVLGASHHILGLDVAQGVRGLNPGLAVRPLEILSASDVHGPLDQGTIYVLPETTAELEPVAGVLTLDAGNLLSHVQLLARNLGIPNATVTSALLPTLRAARGREVFYAVSPRGRVILDSPWALAADTRALLEGERAAAPTEKVALDVSRLRLDHTAPLRLTELRSHHSGVYTGPKAANLGQLGADFPGRVSRGLALPFGMFYQHVNRPFEGDRTVLEELQAAYTRAADMRSAGAAEDEVDRFMFERLAWVRRAIVELEWQPAVRDAIVGALLETFDGDVGVGVFIRSDTNVEDLPQFSGAGLNLTVPHQRTLDGILAAVRRVWTSPFSERAYLWRKQILEEQGQVYPSVLLQESVPSEKSGVAITSGLQHGDSTDLTIAAAEGPGGAVEGEDAETIVVTPAGAVTLLSQAKAPFRRALVSSGAGGVVTLPARRPEYLLLPGEIAQLQDVVADWKARTAENHPGEVWDFEYGFVDGRLWLFQVRPFVRFRSSALLDRLSALDAEIERRGAYPLSLGEVF